MLVHHTNLRVSMLLSLLNSFFFSMGEIDAMLTINKKPSFVKDVAPVTA